MRLAYSAAVTAIIALIVVHFYMMYQNRPKKTV